MPILSVGRSNSASAFTESPPIAPFLLDPRERFQGCFDTALTPAGSSAGLCQYICSLANALVSRRGRIPLSTHSSTKLVFLLPRLFLPTPSCNPLSSCNSRSFSPSCPCWQLLSGPTLLNLGLISVSSRMLPSGQATMESFDERESPSSTRTASASKSA